MLAIRWFENNYMKLDTDKCHLIALGYKYEQVWANIGKDLKLLRITINRDLIDIFQIRKINYNLRHSQKFASTKKTQ